MLKFSVKSVLWKSFFGLLPSPMKGPEAKGFYCFPYVDKWRAAQAAQHFFLAGCNFEMQTIGYCNFRASRPFTEENTDVCTS